jgi:hypothetical protein
MCDENGKLRLLTPPGCVEKMEQARELLGKLETLLLEIAVSAYSAGNLHGAADAAREIRSAVDGAHS